MAPREMVRSGDLIHEVLADMRHQQAYPHADRELIGFPSLPLIFTARGEPVGQRGETDDMPVGQVGAMPTSSSMVGLTCWQMKLMTHSSKRVA